MEAVAKRIEVPRVAERVRVVRVAVAGCGVVGGALVRLIQDEGETIRRRHGLRFELTRVLVRRPHLHRPVPTDLLTSDPDELLAADADVVVEALGGLDPAERIARAALGAGRRLVTANKALIAHRGPELARLARERGGRLDFEAAVAGGVPVVRALRDALPSTGIEAIRGVLNGTTNYILGRMADGEGYAEALAAAQASGFAEADPTRDVNGQDAADKIAILAWLAWGIEPTSVPVRRRGILPDPDRLARDAAAFGGVPRLLAECVRSEAGVSAAVEPVIAPRDSDLGRTAGEENLVAISSRSNGTVRLSGPGAGGAPTASSLLADLLSGAEPVAPSHGAVRVVADPRAHRWVVSVEGGVDAGGTLRRVLEERGVGVRLGRDEPARSIGRALTEPCPWDRLRSVLPPLIAADLRPVVARWEMGDRVAGRDVAPVRRAG